MAPAHGYVGRIYEAHIGAATENPDAIGTFADFERNVLWRVKEGGYNTLQLSVGLYHRLPLPVDP